MAHVSMVSPAQQHGIENGLRAERLRLQSKHLPDCPKCFVPTGCACVEGGSMYPHSVEAHAERVACVEAC
jgi:hypothetical protein